jgi:hypothetical protein
MENDRTAVIIIGSEQYELILTTKATKEISKRYGGIENLGDRLMHQTRNHQVWDYLF